MDQLERDVLHLIERDVRHLMTSVSKLWDEFRNFKATTEREIGIIEGCVANLINKKEEKELNLDTSETLADIDKNIESLYTLKRNIKGMLGDK